MWVFLHLVYLVFKRMQRGRGYFNLVLIALGGVDVVYFHLTGGLATFDDGRGFDL
jgi:hypothetical protein